MGWAGCQLAVRREDETTSMKIVVFSDLDATLLDPRDYSYDAAREALDALRARGGALVLVSSKTFAEMVPLSRELGFADPFVVENGGALVFSDTCPIGSNLVEAFPHVRPIATNDALMLPLGESYETLVRSLAEIAAEAGVDLKGFSAMSNDEIASRTGLPLDQVDKARRRDFDEPFALHSPRPGDVRRITVAAARRGLTVVAGGRFLHLIGHEGKGKAVALLLDAYRQLYGSICTVGLGDSPNDFSFLDLMDIPVLVGGSGSIDRLAGSHPRGLQIPQAGPTGWNLAILQILANLEETL